MADAQPVFRRKITVAVWTRSNLDVSGCICGKNCGKKQKRKSCHRGMFLVVLPDARGAQPNVDPASRAAPGRPPRLWPSPSTDELPVNVSSGARGAQPNVGPAFRAVPGRHRHPRPSTPSSTVGRDVTKRKLLVKVSFVWRTPILRAERPPPLSTTALPLRREPAKRPR